MLNEDKTFVFNRVEFEYREEFGQASINSLPKPNCAIFIHDAPTGLTQETFETFMIGYLIGFKAARSKMRLVEIMDPMSECHKLIYKLR